VTLLDAIEEHRFDAVFGGARRDEEKARGQGAGLLLPRRVRPVGPEEPAARAVEPLQRPRDRKGEHIRVFPLSNWTELDVWQYIAEEDIELPSIYFAHEREVFERDGMLSASTAVHLTPRDGSEEVVEEAVRYRTVGDATCTGAVESTPPPRGGHRRGRRHPDHRARRHPRRRPHQRGRHGRPQAEGYF
jgi:sulfate adenylyltransferase subunit 2